MSSESSLPEEFQKAWNRIQEAVRSIPEDQLQQHAEKILSQYVQTAGKVDEIEFLLGRHLTKGEIHWVHRRLHYGLQVPGDAFLDYEFDQLDAAYRERLARSTSSWRGPAEDIHPRLRTATEK